MEKTHSLVEFNRFEPFGSVANAHGVGVRSVLGSAVDTQANACERIFAERRAQLAKVVDLIVPTGQRIHDIEFDAAPPLFLFEGAALKPVATMTPTLTPRVVSSLGALWRLTDQQLATMTADSLARVFEKIAHFIADGVEEAVVAAIEAVSFPAGQALASAFDATALAAAIAKRALLRSPAGGFGPPVGTTLWCDETVAVKFATVFPSGITSMSMVVSRLLPAGRYYVLPPPAHAPVTMAVSATPQMQLVGGIASAAANYDVRAHVMASAPQLNQISSAPRWTIKGGA